MKNICIYVTVFTLFLISTLNGQVTKFGKCPKVKLAENFDPTKYFTGRFYEQKKFWAIFEIGSKCINAEYTPKGEGMVKVENSGLSLKKGTRFAQVGEAYCDKNMTSACFVRFYPGSPYGSYNLLAADPNKYGLVFSCREVIPGIINTQLAWILTRDKTVSKEDMAKYLDVFKRNGVDTNTFIDTIQDCSDN